MFSNVEPEILIKAYNYLVINGEKNITNMFVFLANKLGGLNIAYEEPEEIPWEGLYHPDADRIFTNIDGYLEWYEKRRFRIEMSQELISAQNNKKRPTIGILFSRDYWINGRLPPKIV